tara:strand:- start:501 stop:659 length:159 start_codon:yes stop_codon:yes gene_type:complete
LVKDRRINGISIDRQGDARPGIYRGRLPSCREQSLRRPARQGINDWIPDKIQ